MKKAVPCEVERINLDFGILARMNKADIRIRYFRFDLDGAFGGHNREQRLRWSNYASHCVHGKLLDDPIDRRREDLQPRSFIDFIDFASQASDLASGFGELSE